MSQLQLTPAPKAFFLPTQHGPCFCLFHEPQGSDKRGSILYLHPFAEELNATRRIVAHQSRKLAQLGYGVLQVDMFGCGDSSGNFEDATWDKWIETARESYVWLTENSSNPVWLWGLRAGALLASSLANELGKNQQQAVNLLLWQPVTNGKQMLQQFLRLKDAGEWLGKRSISTTPAEQSWERGEVVEIAGYAISSQLANDLSRAKLIPPQYINSGVLVWIEVSSHFTPTLSPASEKFIKLWRDAGWKTQKYAVSGNYFWQNISTADAIALCSTTSDAMANPLETVKAIPLI